MTTLEGYVEDIVKEQQISYVLHEIVQEFAYVWLSGADPMDKQKAWNYVNKLLSDLDNVIRKQIRSDRNKDGFAVDLGG